MKKQTKKEQVLEIASAVNSGGEYAVVVNRRVYVCRNNGQFTRSHTNLPGWATFVGSFTFDGFIEWHKHNCGE